MQPSNALDLARFPGHRQCRKCTVSMCQIRNVSSGRLIPIDLSNPVYVIVYRNGQTLALDLVKLLRDGGKITTNAGDVLDAVGLGVSHFATCPVARDFSQAGR